MPPICCEAHNAFPGVLNRSFSRITQARQAHKRLVEGLEEPRQKVN